MPRRPCRARPSRSPSPPFDPARRRFGRENPGAERQPLERSIFYPHPTPVFASPRPGRVKCTRGDPLSARIKSGFFNRSFYQEKQQTPATTPYPTRRPTPTLTHPTQRTYSVIIVTENLTSNFPKVFPKDYDALRPLKLGIDADVLQRWPEVDPVLLRRALAHHTRRDGYLLALLHHRGDRRYDLDGQPVGTVTDADRAEAARLLDASTQRGQTQAEQVRTHKAREEKRRQQRAEEQRRREEKARRKAEHERVQQEIAARKAALIAQGITPESRSERKRRLAREAAERAARRSQAPRPAPDRPPERPNPASQPTGAYLIAFLTY